jgi:hypothetical protein
MQEMQDQSKDTEHKSNIQKDNLQEMRGKKLQGNQERQSQVSLKKEGKHEL